MKRDMELDLLSLLVAWWRHDNRIHLGYPTECPSTRIGWVASKQYDNGPDSNGAGDSDAYGLMLREFGNVVDGMREPHRTAIYVLARNRATGFQVWSSPRLPQNKDEVMRITSEALDILAARV